MYASIARHAAGIISAPQVGMPDCILLLHDHMNMTCQQGFLTSKGTGKEAIVYLSCCAGTLQGLCIILAILRFAAYAGFTVCCIF